MMPGLHLLVIFTLPHKYLISLQRMGRALRQSEVIKVAIGLGIVNPSPIHIANSH